MASNTTNMNLKQWVGPDQWVTSDLSSNWGKVDVHDHTTGKGVQIPTAGIANNAVTAAKIPDGSITTVKLAEDRMKALPTITTSTKTVDTPYRPSTTRPTLIVWDHQTATGGLLELRIENANPPTIVRSKVLVAAPSAGSATGFIVGLVPAGWYYGVYAVSGSWASNPATEYTL